MSNRDGTVNDPEALGDEREEYPDPESYPPPETSDGATPDADIAASDADGRT